MRGLLSRLPTPESSATGNPRDEDLLLVTAAKEDARDFAPLYSLYFDPVYRYCFRRLGHPEAAEDAAAQAFAKALAGLPGYRTNETTFQILALCHCAQRAGRRSPASTAHLDAGSSCRNSRRRSVARGYSAFRGSRMHDP